jgi:VWFA-related protein
MRMRWPEATGVPELELRFPAISHERLSSVRPIVRIGVAVPHSRLWPYDGAMQTGYGAMAGALLVTAAVGVAARADTPRLVSVPLFVTDARGQSIRNLQPPEIEIAEGGTSHKVSSVVFRGASSRRVALFLDEYHVAPGAATERARQAAARFVERHLHPADAVVVMKPLDPQSSTAPAPSIESVHRSIAAFDGRRGVYQPRSEFEAQYMSVAPAAANLQRAQVVRAALESLAIAMRDDAGAAKAMIVVTEGFSPGEPSRMRTTTLRTIGRAARLANVPVYILDPSADWTAGSPLNDAWRAVSAQTGGMLFPGGSDLDEAFTRVAADLQSHYVVEFQGAGKEDGAFHGIDVKVNRRGAQVRAASGYWAPFAASRLPPMTPRRAYANLLTPHISGLIQPWFRMSPGTGGRTRVTFSWAPRPGRKVPAERVQFSALTFEGDTLHAATLAPAGTPAGPAETTFEVPPGPLQISMAIGAAKPLATDVRYIDVPRLDGARPYIAAIDFVRPRSLPEFTAMRSNGAVVPTDTREFLRQDRLLVRVRAFAASGPVDVEVRLLNRLGQPLLDLPRLEPVDGVAQFELPFARYPRGEYRLHVRATAGGQTVTQLLSVTVIG